MGNLYKDLADIYEAMYQTFINYKDEYLLYSGLLKKHGKHEVLEIGSGTGNLAKFFYENDFEYAGLDYSKDMIAIAKNKLMNGRFLQGDMRNFQLEKPVQSIIITGRTISYLLKNEDVTNTFSTINTNLETGGILCFDFIDANEFIPAISKGKMITHEASFEKVNYLRKSKWTLDLDRGMSFKWNSIYYKKVGQDLQEVGEDHSTIRTFTINEMEIFLAINQFEIKEIIAKPAYAFPTYVIVAEKLN